MNGQGERVWYQIIGFESSNDEFAFEMKTKRITSCRWRLKQWCEKCIQGQKYLRQGIYFANNCGLTNNPSNESQNRVKG